ncbi:DciA family protein [Ramlibacter rhizophilus]|uniref:DUF721 domain-containing protein n=1 Tax=Ramlibacter rhizophilus TaxID=1781167 RepID=A0A4Z0BPP5_9BURK|nr:DciA family protein [Ramlibacter rhizophilus]TFZ00025.1 DUF721 domain-containing protein [Ramlibacter rhizophilus]
MPPEPSRRRHAVTLQQAAQEAPALARLASLVRASSQCLEAIQPMLPPGLKASVKAGPLDGGTWCLLVASNAGAAKLRQLLPTLLEQLHRRGMDVSSIRLKVQADRH